MPLRLNREPQSQLINCWACLTPGNESTPGKIFEDPDHTVVALSGLIYNSPVHDDGERIVLTPIMGVDAEGRVVTREGKAYILGTVNAEYAAEFPNATARLLASLPYVG